MKLWFAGRAIHSPDESLMSVSHIALILCWSVFLEKGLFISCLERTGQASHVFRTLCVCFQDKVCM